jgi:hypothetical protein
MSRVSTLNTICGSWAQTTNACTRISRCLFCHGHIRRAVDQAICITLYMQPLVRLPHMLLGCIAFRLRFSKAKCRQFLLHVPGSQRSTIIDRPSDFLCYGFIMTSLATPTSDVVVIVVVAIVLILAIMVVVLVIIIFAVVNVHVHWTVAESSVTKIFEPVLHAASDTLAI